MKDKERLFNEVSEVLYKLRPFLQRDGGDAELIDVKDGIARLNKVSEDQLFYLMSRGLTEAEATQMIIMGFIEPFTKELPMEYAVEMNRLIKFQMEGSIG